jgi:RNA polymerase sigma factor for flagellar operon FliA
VDYQKLLIEHLDLVDRVVRHIARRHHLPGSDAEELSSLVRLRLLDQNFAVLRKFQGRSNLATYLTAVIEHIYLDFCVAQWGKWRPSAAARRLGPLAILLDQLVTRDGLSFDEAVTTLSVNHGCQATPEELQQIYMQLPTRSVRRPAAEEELAVVASRVGTRDKALEYEDDLETVERVEAALAQILADLSPREQLILRLRFKDGLSLAAIGRLLHTAAKPLYRQLDATIARVRDKLCQQNIDAQDIDRIVGHPALTLGRLLNESAVEPADRDDGSV